jgi:hypothetical protein
MKDGAKPKLCAGELRRDSRKRNRLKREKAIDLLANVKGMGVILHGLRPVPINR